MAKRRQRESYYGVHVGASVSPDLAERIERLADEAGVGKSVVIRTALESGLTPARRKLLKK